MTHVMRLLQKFLDLPWKKLPWKQLASWLSIAVLLFWGIFFTYRWANAELRFSSSQASARLFQINGDLQNLPQPNFIKAGQTSGNAAGVITKYEQTAKSMRQISKQLGPPLLPRLLLFWKANPVASAGANGSKALELAAQELEATTAALKAAQKFIEYAPAADLATISNDPTSDTKERLERTQAGLQRTVDELNYTAYQPAGSMADKLGPLVAQASKITPQTLPAWCDSVLSIQKQYVQTFQANWQPYTQRVGVSLNRSAETILYQ